MPVVREIQAERRAAIETGNAAPVGSGGGPTEPPAVETVRQGGAKWFRARRRFSTGLTRELAAGFRQMQDLQLLDLDNRKGKAPGGYQSTLPRRGCRSFS